MQNKFGFSQSPSLCLWSQVLVALAVVLLGWTAFSELFANNAGSMTEKSVVDGILSDSHTYAPPLTVIDSFDCEFLTRVRAQTVDGMKRIEKNWQVEDFPNFLKMMHIPPTSWSLQKAKFVHLLMEQSTATPENKKNDFFGRSFVAGFSGSSVTAGHDNFFKEAFPSVFQQSLKPVFDAMRMKLVVRNDAIGNNPCFPYDACIATHLGDDLDFLAWEQSMNCGRDSRPLDTFTRNALRMKKSPTVMFVLSGGPSWRPEDCQNSSNLTPMDIIRKNRLTSPVTAKTIRDISSQLDLNEHHKSSSNSHYSNILSSMEFLRDGSEHLFDAHRFAAAAPMGHSTFPCQEYHCLGPYNANFTLKTPGGNGANWHPGAMGHKLRGENMAYFMLAILLDAIDSIREVQQLDATACPPIVYVPPSKTITPSTTTNPVIATEEAPTTTASKDATNSVPPTTTTQTEQQQQKQQGRRHRHLSANTVEFHSRTLSSVSSASASSSSSATLLADPFDVRFPSSVSLDDVINHMSLTSVSTAPAIDKHKLSSRILRYVHHHALTKAESAGSDDENGRNNSTHQSEKGRNNNANEAPALIRSSKGKKQPLLPTSVTKITVTVNVWTMITAYVEDFLFRHLHHAAVIPPVPSHYHVDETIFAPNCYTNFEPRTLRDHSLSALYVNESNNNYFAPRTSTEGKKIKTNGSVVFLPWQLQLSPFDANAVNKAQQRGLGYLDRKIAYFSQGQGSRLYLRIKVVHNAPIWLCELQKGFLKYPATMTDLDQGADINVYMHFFYRHTSKSASSASSFSAVTSTLPTSTSTKTSQQQQQQSALAAISSSVSMSSHRHLRQWDNSTHSTAWTHRGLSNTAVSAVHNGNNNNNNHHLGDNLDDEAHTLHIKLSLLADQCYRSTVPVPAGDHLLSIEQKGAQQINLAYLLTF